MSVCFVCFVMVRGEENGEYHEIEEDEENGGSEPAVHGGP